MQLVRLGKTSVDSNFLVIVILNTLVSKLIHHIPVGDNRMNTTSSFRFLVLNSASKMYICFNSLHWCILFATNYFQNIFTQHFSSSYPISSWSWCRSLSETFHDWSFKPLAFHEILFTHNPCHTLPKEIRQDRNVALIMYMTMSMFF